MSYINAGRLALLFTRNRIMAEAGKHADKQGDKQGGKHTDKHADKQGGKHADKHAGKQGGFLDSEGS